MTDYDINANKALVRLFVDTMVRHDYAAIESLLHPDFIWNTAITGDDDANELRPMQSRSLSGKALPYWKPRLDRAEALAVFKKTFEGQYEGSMGEPSDKETAKPVQVKDDTHRMRMDVLSLTAEEDRVAMEAESHVLHPSNGRVYNNFYHNLFRIRDGKIVLFKEYQDTLHLYDYLAE